MIYSLVPNVRKTFGGLAIIEEPRCIDVVAIAPIFARDPTARSVVFV